MKSALRAAAALASASLAGCMSVEMPKHMVSDTVDATVRVYDRVTGKPREQPGLEIAWTAVFDGSTPVDEATRRCFERAGIHAREALRNEGALVTPVSDTLRKYGALYGVECRVRAVLP